MSTIFLILHIATAILFLGPVMVTVSAFGKQALAASQGDTRAEGIATNMHGVTKVYGYLSALVPIFGLILMIIDWDVYSTRPNFHTAILLAVVAWGILLGLIIPRQKKAVSALGNPEGSTVDFAKTKSQLAMFGGIFNLLWIITLILMFF